MKTAFFDLAGWEIPLINQRSKDLGVTIIKTSTSPFDVAHLPAIKDVEILSVFLSKIDQAMMEQLPQLKLISVRATGVDHVDLDFAKKKGIVVTYLPSYAESTVAEYAIALALMLARRLKTTVSQCVAGTFDQKTTRGNDLSGKTLGIIGTGRIGCKLAKIAHGLDMNVLCYDIREKPELVVTCEVKYVPLDTLFKTSDVISIHAPYTPQTHHLINMDTLKILKKGVLLVNAARGAIVDISALRQGLKDQVFGGVALDTFEGEDIWIHQEHIFDKTEAPTAAMFKQAIEAISLLKFDNVILTPHNAYNSHEAVQRMIETTLQDITMFCQKGDCSNRVV